MEDLEKAAKREEARIALHEGIRLFPYRCTANKLTIGIGRNLEDKGISKEEAYYLLRNDLKECHKQCCDSFWWYGEMDLVRQSIIKELCLNIGIGGLKKFKNMLLACSLKNYREAAKQMLDSKWATQVGKRAQTMAKIMETGIDNTKY